MTLFDLNHLPKQQLMEELFKCCGSTAWVNKMLTVFPVEDFIDLTEDAEEKWYECTEEDWKEAFSYHPEIGDIDSLKKKLASTVQWAAGEQSGIDEASEKTLQQFDEGNKAYKEKFGYIFIVSATGRPAEEMLAILQSRLSNDPKEEIEIAAEEQNMITKIRLEKLLQ